MGAHPVALAHWKSGRHNPSFIVFHFALCLILLRIGRLSSPAVLLGARTLIASGKLEKMVEEWEVEQAKVRQKGTRVKVKPLKP